MLVFGSFDIMRSSCVSFAKDVCVASVSAFDAVLPAARASLLAKLLMTLTRSMYIPGLALPLQPYTQPSYKTPTHEQQQHPGFVLVIGHLEELFLFLRFSATQRLPSTTCKAL